jgi:DNA-binding NarL/FixJ family response regulator
VLKAPVFSGRENPALAAVLRPAVTHPESGGSPDLLTAREREVLQPAAEGNTTKADAAKPPDQRPHARPPPDQP